MKPFVTEQDSETYLLNVEIGIIRDAGLTAAQFADMLNVKQDINVEAIYQQTVHHTDNCDMGFVTTKMYQFEIKHRIELHYPQYLLHELKRIVLQQYYK